MSVKAKRPTMRDRLQPEAGAVAAALRGAQGAAEGDTLAGRQAGKPARRQASKATRGGAELGERVKATFYLDREDLRALEDERHRRRTEGRAGADLSAIVREAIRGLLRKRRG